MNTVVQEVNTSVDQKATPTDGYDWAYIIGIALEHKRMLIAANIVAILAVIASVPIPLLFPLLVDEVLLKQPGDFMRKK